MEKTLILGSNKLKEIHKSLKEVGVVAMTFSSVNNEGEIMDFIETNIPSDLDKIIINLNEIDTSLALHIALRIRLMLFSLKKTSLSAIILVCESSFETLVDYSVASLLLMTKGVFLVSQEELPIAIENSEPLKPTEYISEFLNLIKILPKENVEGRHSIANEWGADILSQVITYGQKTEFIPLRASASLYFLYCRVSSLNVADIEKIAEGKPRVFLFGNLKITDEFSYLLIDDEASKGWSEVLQIMMPKATATVFDKKVNSYTELPPDMRTHIENGVYDIIFLDLRMNGVEEESITNPDDFSGMKILKSIKRINPGIQVIMLTATNKGWNVQAMLNAGANGYYMKESPEYHFPLNYSEQNAKSFQQTIKECLSNAYLQDIYEEIKNLSLPDVSPLSDDIAEQLKLSFNLILKANSDNEVAFAYIALEQIFEISTSALIEKCPTRDGYEYFFTSDTAEKCKLYDGLKPEGFLFRKKHEKETAQWKKVAAIYYQLFDGLSTDFTSKLKTLINLRNDYIHPEGKSVKISKEDYIQLFNLMIEFLKTFK